MDENKSCCDKKSCYAKLSICNLAMALGLVWGLSMFVLGLLATGVHMGTPLVHAFGSLYLGYNATFLGSFIGLAWGFIDGFIGGALIAFFYNWCRCCCPCSYCKKGRCACAKCGCEEGKCKCESGKCDSGKCG